MGGNDDTVGVGGKLYAGQNWDYVFDVDAEEGTAPRKLPANRGEDPYVIADRFLLQEGLPDSYRHVRGTCASSTDLHCPVTCGLLHVEELVKPDLS